MIDKMPAPVADAEWPGIIDHFCTHHDLFLGQLATLLQVTPTLPCKWKKGKGTPVNYLGLALEGLSARLGKKWHIDQARGEHGAENS